MSTSRFDLLVNNDLHESCTHNNIVCVLAFSSKDRSKSEDRLPLQRLLYLQEKLLVQLVCGVTGQHFHS